MNDHSTPTQQTTERTVMATIEQGSVKMRSRWFFIIQTALVGACILVISGMVVYVVSLAVFVTEESGVWVAPQYGWQGFLLFARSIPWFLIISAVTLLSITEVMARRFSFVYSRPLAYSFALLVVCIAVAGSVVAQTSFHRSLSEFVNRHQVPIVPMWYKRYDPEAQQGVWRGRVIMRGDGRFVIERRSGLTTTIMISTETRLPPFPINENDRVMVIGVGETSTVSAWGIRLAPAFSR
jgi:hypothetical protein